MSNDIPRLTAALSKQVLQVLEQLWPHAPKLSYNATVDQTCDAIKQMVEPRWPNTKFKFKTAKEKYNPNNLLVGISWIHYPDCPNIPQFSAIVEPYSFLRNQVARNALASNGIELEPILLNAILKATWGPIRGINLDAPEPNEKQLHAWQVKQIRAKKRALTEVASTSKPTASRPRTKKPSM